MKKLFMTSLLAVLVGFIPTKKAEAGILLLTGQPGMVILGSMIVSGTVDLMLNGGNVYGGAPISLILLDEEDSNQLEDEYQTVPSYVFNEIEGLAKAKRTNGNKFEEVIFTDEEVDSLFISLDSRVSSEELDSLRKALTTSSLMRN